MEQLLSEEKVGLQLPGGKREGLASVVGNSPCTWAVDGGSRSCLVGKEDHDMEHPAMQGTQDVEEVDGVDHHPLPC